MAEKENVFYKDFYLKELSDVRIVSVFDEEGDICVAVDRNIFHPHGGGQKGDRGAILHNGSRYVIKNTVKDKYSDVGVLLLMEDPVPESLVGEPVICQLDWDFRFAQMRLHTAVHLHHCMLEKVLGKALKPPKTSDIQEDFAFNRYEKGAVSEENVESANREMFDLINIGAEVRTYPDPKKEGFRWWNCLAWKIPCGGTHVADVKEIGNIKIEFSKKKGMPTINFSLP